MKRGLTKLISGVVIVDLGPGRVDTTSNELLLLRVQCNACNLVLHIDRLQQRSCIVATVEVHRLASCNAQDGHSISNSTGSSYNVGELASSNISLDSKLLNDRASPQVEPADELVISHRDQNILIVGPDNALDGTLVYTGANLEALVSGNRSAVADFWGSGGVGRLGVGGKIKDSKLLLHATSREQISGVRGEGNGPDDVVVLQGEVGYAGVGIEDSSVQGAMSARACAVSAIIIMTSDLRSEVGRCGSG